MRPFPLQMDDVERILVRRFAAFLQQRAEAFLILRRAPMPGYDLSVLITHAHTETLIKDRLVDFLIGFLEDIDKEVSAMRLSLNARARSIATAYLESMAR